MYRDAPNTSMAASLHKVSDLTWPHEINFGNAETRIRNHCFARVQCMSISDCNYNNLDQRHLLDSTPRNTAQKALHMFLLGPLLLLRNTCLPQWRCLHPSNSTETPQLRDDKLLLQMPTTLGTPDWSTRGCNCYLQVLRLSTKSHVAPPCVAFEPEDKRTDIHIHAHRSMQTDIYICLPHTLSMVPEADIIARAWPSPTTNGVGL